MFKFLANIGLILFIFSGCGGGGNVNSSINGKSSNIKINGIDRQVLSMKPTIKNTDNITIHNNISEEDINLFYAVNESYPFTDLYLLNKQIHCTDYGFTENVIDDPDIKEFTKNNGDNVCDEFNYNKSQYTLLIVLHEI